MNQKRCVAIKEQDMIKTLIKSYFGKSYTIPRAKCPFEEFCDEIKLDKHKMIFSHPHIEDEYYPHPWHSTFGLVMYQYCNIVGTRGGKSPSKNHTLKILNDLFKDSKQVHQQGLVNQYKTIATNIWKDEELLNGLLIFVFDQDNDSLETIFKYQKKGEFDLIDITPQSFARCFFSEHIDSKQLTIHLYLLWKQELEHRTDTKQFEQQIGIVYEYIVFQNKKEKSMTQKKQEQEEAKLCKICFEKEKDVVFLPCGHEACCEDCAKAVGKKKPCPVCNTLINAYTKIFKV